MHIVGNNPVVAEAPVRRLAYRLWENGAPVETDPVYRTMQILEAQLQVAHDEGCGEAVTVLFGSTVESLDDERVQAVYDASRDVMVAAGVSTRLFLAAVDGYRDALHALAVTVRGEQRGCLA